MAIVLQSREVTPIAKACTESGGLGKGKSTKSVAPGAFFGERAASLISLMELSMSRIVPAHKMCS